MELNKIAQYKAKNEPYLKPISDLGIGFYNLDEQTATLQFQIYNEHGPLLISNENVDVHGYFESSNGSVSSVLEIEVVDGLNGIAQITLEKEFLQASTSTKVIGQIYISVNNIENKPEYNQTAVFGEFTFRVADSLINKVSSFTKVEYIRMFDRLRDEIISRAKEMEQNVGEIETLVQEVNDAVADGKKGITKIGNDAIGKLQNIANNSNQQIAQYANQAKTDIDTKIQQQINSLSSQTRDKINEVNSKADTVIDKISGSDVITNEDTTNWQKYQLTLENGASQVLQDANVDSDNFLNNLKPGFYFVSSPSNSPSGSSGFLTVFQNFDAKVAYYQPYDNDDLYINRYYNIWSGWKKVSNINRDTGWQPLTLKAGYKSSSVPDFEPAYRVVENGNTKTVHVRMGIESIKDGKNIVATIPQDLAPYKIYRTAVSTNNKIPPKVIVSGGNIEFHTNQQDSYSNTDYIIFQDSWIV
ncbi:hypothetical protein [Staphylococcus simulans]